MLPSRDWNSFFCTERIDSVRRVLGALGQEAAWSASAWEATLRTNREASLVQVAIDSSRVRDTGGYELPRRSMQTLVVVFGVVSYVITDDGRLEFVDGVYLNAGSFAHAIPEARLFRPGSLCSRVSASTPRFVRDDAQSQQRVLEPRCLDDVLLLGGDDLFDRVTLIPRIGKQVILCVVVCVCWQTRHLAP